MRNKGISLIVLIITMVVIIILATAIIVNIAKSNIIENANEAVEKSSLSEAKEKMQFLMLDLMSQEQINDKLTIDDLNKLNSGEVTVGSTESFPVEVILSGYKFSINDKYEINYIGKSDETIISYETEVDGYTNKNEVKIILNISSPNGLKSIEKPNNEIENLNGEKNKTVEYIATSNGKYLFKAIDVKENEITKEVVIEKIDTLGPLDFTVDVENVSDSEIKIKVNANDSEETSESVKSGIGKYEFYIKKKNETEYVKYESTENIYTINNLTHATEYEIYVVVFDRANNSKSLLDFSEIISTKTLTNLSSINDPIKIQNGLVNYWPLQSDFVNYVNPGDNDLVDLNGTATFAEGGVYLEDNCLSTPNNYQLSGNQTTFLQYKRTIEPSGWVHLFGYSADRNRYCYYNNGMHYDSYEDKLCLIAYSNYGSHISFDINEVLPLNTWVNIVVTTDDEKTTVYFGDTKSSNEILYKYEEKWNYPAYPLSIGGNSNYKSYYFDGYYKNFGIFNRALSEEEVQNLFN